MPKVLVAGLLAYESGKTTLALGLADELLSRGASVAYLKPVAGHNGWYQPDTVEATEELGILVGHDVYLAAKELGDLDKVAAMNPLDIMSLPLDPFAEGATIRSYVDSMEVPLRSSVLVRLSLAQEPAPGASYMLVGENLRRLSPVSREILGRVLAATGARDRAAVIGLAELEAMLNRPELYAAVDVAMQPLASREFVIVEGYNDVAAPTRWSCLSDYAIVVAPTKAALYRGDRYCRAVEVASPGRPWASRASSVASILGRPDRVFDVPARANLRAFKKAVGDIAEAILRARP